MSETFACSRLVRLMSGSSIKFASVSKCVVHMIFNWFMLDEIGKRLKSCIGFELAILAFV